MDFVDGDLLLAYAVHGIHSLAASRLLPPCASASCRAAASPCGCRRPASCSFPIAPSRTTAPGGGRQVALARHSRRQATTIPPARRRSGAQGTAQPPATPSARVALPAPLYRPVRWRRFPAGTARPEPHRPHASWASEGAGYGLRGRRCSGGVSMQSMASILPPPPALSVGWGEGPGASVRTVGALVGLREALGIHPRLGGLRMLQDPGPDSGSFVPVDLPWGLLYNS